MIPVCHNLRRYASKVLKGIATNGKGTIYVITQRVAKRLTGQKEQEG